MFIHNVDFTEKNKQEILGAALFKKDLMLWNTSDLCEI